MFDKRGYKFANSWNLQTFFLIFGIGFVDVVFLKPTLQRRFFILFTRAYGFDIAEIFHSEGEGAQRRMIRQEALFSVTVFPWQAHQHFLYPALMIIAIIRHDLQRFGWRK